MANQIIQQPNGLYALWSTVVDDFILIHATRNEVVDYFVSKERARIAASVDGILSQLEKGEPPYYQFSVSYQDAINQSKRVTDYDLRGDTKGMRLV